MSDIRSEAERPGHLDREVKLFREQWHSNARPRIELPANYLGARNTRFPGA